MNICKFISEKVYIALISAGAPSNCKAQVKRSINDNFGDYQVNGIMNIAKKTGLSSKYLAKHVVDFLYLTNIAYKIDIVDPGFINIFLSQDWLGKKIKKNFSLPRLGINNVVPQTIVVDYSAPNVAKEMHVGHIRSTIIGDSLVRTLTFLGHKVIKVNHIGDWGTQFGMLIAYIKKVRNKKLNMKISNLENLYRDAKKCYDEDFIFAKNARDCVVKLQNGDKFCIKIWKEIVNISIKYNQKIYNRLDITLKKYDIMGESLYNSMLPNIVEDLKKKGLAIENENAIVVVLNEFKNKKGEPMGVIIQKKDGAYLYTTTDIACAKYRYEILKADRIIYCTDSRQNQHLMQVWTIVRKAGYVPESVLFEHHMFGMILDKNGKPLKTRTGKTVKLSKLLDEALERARRLIISKNNFINPVKLEKLAKIISVGAIKYSDLSKNRNTDYIFNWDNMLNFDGNTAPYIQYAYARIISIFRKNNNNRKKFISKIYLTTKYEHKLAVHLLQLEEIIIVVARDGTPHILCSYLYKLSVLFSIFYEYCPVINISNEEISQSRLQLSLFTARTLKKGLNLLGIKTVKYM